MGGDAGSVSGYGGAEAHAGGVSKQVVGVGAVGGGVVETGAVTTGVVGTGTAITVSDN